MAYERTSDAKVKGDSLDAFVTNISKTFANQLAIRNTEDETNFNTAVLENDLSVEDQLAYRQEQLKRVSDDPNERKRIRLEIATLKDRVVQKKYSDEYLAKLTNFESGVTSIDSVIDFLNDQLSTATDQTILDSVRKELGVQLGKKFELTKQMLNNQTDYAVKDKSESVINDQIVKVENAKAKALIAGDTATSSMFDLQLQSLNKARDENSISKDIKNFAVASITGFASAVKLLDSYNSKIANSPSTSPVKIGDVTYDSSKEFWTFKRDSYVADQSAAGLFSRLSDEATSAVKVADSKNILDTTFIQNSLKDINSLAGRPELAGYETKIDTTKQGVLQTGANLVTASVTDQFSTDYDLNKAVNSLNSLKALGVNVSDAFTKLLTAAASIKQGQVNNILQAASTAMQNDPNLTPEMAIKAAIGAGAGVVLSPQQLTKKDESTISTDLSNTSTAGTGAVDPRLTVTPPAASLPANAGAEIVGQPTVPFITIDGKNYEYKAPGAGAPAQDTARTITVKSGETVASIAAREFGSADRLNEIMSLNGISDPNKITPGTVIKLPGGTATAPATQPAPAAVIKPQAPAAAPAAPIVAPPAPSVPTPSQTYQIKQGDTLGKIAQMNGTTVDALTKLNNILDPNKIQAGASIKIK